MTDLEGTSDLTELTFAAAEAGRIASLIFNAPVLGDPRIELMGDYRAWLEKMDSPELTLADRRTIWEHYGETFMRDSLPCLPTLPSC